MVRGVSIRVSTYHRGNRWFWVVSDAFQNTIATGAQPFKTRLLARKAGVVARDEYVKGENEQAAKKNAAAKLVVRFDPVKLEISAKQLRNANNHSQTHFVTFQSETMSVSDWCRRLNIPYKRTIQRLITLKWSVDDAFTLPHRYQGCKKGEE